MKELLVADGGVVPFYALQLFNVTKPTINRDGLHSHSLLDAAHPNAGGYRHLILNGHIAPEVFMFLEIIGEPEFRTVSVLSVLLIDPIRFVHGVVCVENHYGRIKRCLVRYASL